MSRKQPQKAEKNEQRVELPSAKDLMKQIAQKEAEKASEYMRRQAAADAEKKALMDKLTNSSGVSDEEALRRVAVIIQRAVSNGSTEVQVARFPNSLCTDGGRAINNLEAGWESTLTGVLGRCICFGKSIYALKGIDCACRSWIFRKACPEMSE